MRALVTVALVLALVPILGSCSVKGRNVPDDKTPAGGTPSEISEESGFELVRFEAGDQRNEDKEIAQPTTSFARTTPVIYVTAAVKGVNKGAKIRGALRAVDVVTAGGEQVRDQDVVSDEVTATDVDAIANFEYSAPDKAWPVGKYVVNLTLDGQLVAPLDLAVEEAAP